MRTLPLTQNRMREVIPFSAFTGSSSLFRFFGVRENPREIHRRREDGCVRFSRHFQAMNTVLIRGHGRRARNAHSLPGYSSKNARRRCRARKTYPQIPPRKPVLRRSGVRDGVRSTNSPGGDIFSTRTEKQRRGTRNCRAASRVACAFKQPPVLQPIASRTKNPRAAETAQGLNRQQTGSRDRGSISPCLGSKRPFCRWLWSPGLPSFRRRSTTSPSSQHAAPS